MSLVPWLDVKLFQQRINVIVNLIGNTPDRALWFVSLKEKERKKERKRERESVCVCVCVCVRARWKTSTFNVEAHE